MNTIYAGKKLLEILGSERKTPIQATKFFDDEFWPLMFNSEDPKHLMQVHNSDFFQSSYVKSAVNENVALPLFRKQKFESSLNDTIMGTKSISGNIGVGFMASGPAETTYGQVSDIAFNFTKEDLLYSWYGAALGIGFGGGIDFISYEPDIIRFIYSGWPYYRKLIEDTPRLKGRQIETWNGLWLNYGLKYRNDLDRAYYTLSQKINEHSSTNNGIVKLDRPEWSNQVLTLAIEYGGDKNLTFQGYNFGSTNKSFGSLIVHLPKIKWMTQLFNHLLQQEDGLDNKQLTDVFKAHYSLSYAAQFGELGLRAITPKNLPYYFGNSISDKKKTEKEKSPYQFIIYKSWIIAMLNNEELHELAQQLADELLKYKKLGKTAQSTETDKINNVETLWSLRRNSRFIDQISGIINEISRPSDVFARVIRAVASEMTPDQLQLFISLARFEYIYKDSNETPE
jgi:hypothetical protein